MNQTRQTHHMTQLLFALSVTCLFAATALVVIIAGANVYQKTTENMDYNSENRIVSSYITEKVRQYDTAGNISYGSLADIPALVLKYDLDHSTYRTYIYAYNGQLKELFTKDGTQLSPEAGSDIAPVEEFTIDVINDNLYRFIVIDNARERLEFFISPRSRQNT